ncbi:alpha/beta fold hydrolase [Janthinobacterium fluminis]|uniref:Alpha/beta hydrolase n=1 Tax=Janthinobacterium fluminis TaxID=2987524 RepID=A0ABT5JVR5_9BURK|nr:alpha/beta hydrolase [Janthinobacterium fluminis]MDC8756817.1 alpha/beta hydrolase [Janthinobacterium fluminis]
MATIIANNITIAYETHGDPAAPPVLMVMGLGTPLTSWPLDLVEGLAEQGFYVIRFDNRDCGLSSKFDHLGAPNLALAFLKHVLGWPLKTAYTLHDMAEDALALLAALNIRQAHVIGASMGGMIAQIMAARAPRRVLSLTSIMSTSGRRTLPGPTRAARKALLRGPRDPRDRAQLIAHMMKTFRVIASPAYPTSDRQLRSMVEVALQRNPSRAGMARQIVAVAAADDRSELLKSIRCPALVIHGAADPLIPVACGIDTAHAIPDATLHVIEGMGHDLPPQLIERLLALIDTHLHGKMVAHPGRVGAT